MIGIQKCLKMLFEIFMVFGVIPIERHTRSKGVIHAMTSRDRLVN